MGLRRFVKKQAQSNFNVKKWIGFDQVKRTGGFISETYRDLYQQGKTDGVKETFEDAMRRYNLSEADLQRRMKSSLMIARICTIFGGVVLLYTFYLFALSDMISGLLTLAFSALMLVYGFREHFNYYQMKQRRLGCSVSEWFRSLYSKDTQR